MQYHLKVFQTEDRHEFRIVDRNGEPWFVLADVCRVLEIGNPSQAASRLDEDEKATLINDEGRPGDGAQSFTIINESGLYSLILTSRKPSAKRFKKWVTSEVLPSIRKTGGYTISRTTPAFIKRFNLNWDRVDPGYFSVINELATRLWGRFEMVGHVLADTAADGKELRPDVSVGKLFASWLDENHPEHARDFSYYVHSTPQWECQARQYPLRVLPLFIEFVDTVWLLKHAEAYLRHRDPAALPHLPKLLAAPSKPKPGMVKQPTVKRLLRKA